MVLRSSDYEKRERSRKLRLRNIGLDSQNCQSPPSCWRGRRKAIKNVRIKITILVAVVCLPLPSVGEGGNSRTVGFGVRGRRKAEGWASYLQVSSPSPKKQIYCFFRRTGLGLFAVAWRNDEIALLRFGPSCDSPLLSNFVSPPTTERIEGCVKQPSIRSYFPSY
jgi:hypothetical protein